MLLWLPDDMPRIIEILDGARRVVAGTAILGGGPATAAIARLARTVPVLVVTGCGEGRTTRDAVERLRGAGAEVLVVNDLRPTNALSHMKVIAVVGADGLGNLLVGSANLTAGGFGKNTEAVHLSEVTVVEVDAIEARLRMEGPLLADLDDLPTPAPPSFEGSPKRPPLGDLLQLGWDGYIEAVYSAAAAWRRKGWHVFAVDGQVGWMNTLDDLVAWTGGDLADLAGECRDLLVGIGRGKKDVAYFGDFANTPAKQIIREPSHHPTDAATIDAARRSVRRIGEPVTLAEAQDAFDSLTAIKGVSAGVASRLLLSVRPDVFVSVNRGSKPLLRDQAHLTFPDEDKRGIRRDYARLLEMVMNAPWWNAPRPTDRDGRVIWGARAALLDVFLYTV